MQNQHGYKHQILHGSDQHGQVVRNRTHMWQHRHPMCTDRSNTNRSDIAPWRLPLLCLTACQLPCRLHLSLRPCPCRLVILSPCPCPSQLLPARWWQTAPAAVPVLRGCACHACCPAAGVTGAAGQHVQAQQQLPRRLEVRAGAVGPDRCSGGKAGWCLLRHI